MIEIEQQGCETKNHFSKKRRLPNNESATTTTTCDKSNTNNNLFRPDSAVGTTKSSAAAAAAAETVSPVVTQLSQQQQQQQQQQQSDDDDDDDDDKNSNNNNEEEEEEDNDGSGSVSGRSSSVNLPTSIELSKELCKIVDTDQYSRDESLCTLQTLDVWASTQDSTFFNYFLLHGGIIKVLDFINIVVKDIDEWHGYFMEIVMTAVKYDELLTLLRASNECSSNEDDDDDDDDENNWYTSYQLAALKEIWIALVNITSCDGIFGLVGKERTMYVFGSGMDIIWRLKHATIDIPIASEIGAQVFDALKCIMSETNYMTNNEFQKENIIPHCLNVFKKDNDSSTWVYGSEKLIVRAIDFIDTCYDHKSFISTPKDSLSIIPLCILGLKEFPTNNHLRKNVRQLLTRICCISGVSTLTIEKTGVLEGIVPLLTSDTITDHEKCAWRSLVIDTKEAVLKEAGVGTEKNRNNNMASNDDNIIKVEGGEDKNTKKRRMSAVANDGDDDSNEKKKKNESSTGDRNTNSDLFRPDTNPHEAISSRKKLIGNVAREEQKRKISNLWQWLLLQRQSVKLSQEQKDRLERIKYKTVSFSRTTLPILSITTAKDDAVAASATFAETVPPVITDPSQQKESYSVDAADEDDDDTNEKKKNESSTGNGNNSNNLMNRSNTVGSKSSSATTHTPTAAEIVPPAITQPSQQEESDAELPTSIELSKELCKIVDTDHYSRDESLCALKNLSMWSYTEDSRFFKYFAFHGGIVKVLDFLTIILEEPELAIGTNSMECIEFAANIVGNVCYEGKDGVNSDISLEIATTAVKYDKLGTLLRANNECNDFENNISHLKAVKDIWTTFTNIIACNGILDLIGKEQTMHLFDAGMDIIKKLKFINVRHTIAITTNIGGPVFDALNYIFYGTNYVTYNEFKDRNFLSHCLNIFKKDDGTWVYGSEELIQSAINCIDTCHNKKLFAGITDYESILPLCVLCLKEFSTNDEIRVNVRRLLAGACSSRVNNRAIEKTGVLEDIVPLLNSDIIDDDEKTKWRDIVTKIIAP
ncbi:hypothetical protein FRACYDRAFT_244927 [Fragilariopsis cylindrus CCMP1102]|uniref:Uncharacterized protein n=1 Tax=Fragilariopsis cylindrus CCMP1102 TaxID=635003 RepID=A0A1E7F1W2_9STRA|nr:hypothetical protein FRACYDRAFT_244927 [Fragilariopsis cylindrus CCMP1102]|eukprot:OEU11803.1 hypothetical protein FRACYDRAFT_244927 [Fragilariopsis cylindrus CCMP1102]